MGDDMTWPIDLHGQIDSRSFNIPVKCGPFINGTDTYFILAGDGIPGRNKLVAVKATDTSDVSAWSEVDGSNSPTSGSLITVYSCVLLGTKIHCVFEDSAVSQGVYYARFDMTLDQWDEIDTSQKEVLIAEADIVNHWCDLGVRSNGDIVVVLSGAEEKVHGVDWARLYFSISTDFGQTWTATVTLQDGDQINRICGRMVMGPDNTAHAVLVETTIANASRMFQISISSGGSLQTYRDTGIDAYANLASLGGQYPIGPGFVYDQSGTDVVRFPFKQGIFDGLLDVLEFDSAADPSGFTAAGTIDSRVPKANASAVTCGLAADSLGRAWLVWLANVSNVGIPNLTSDDIADVWDAASEIGSIGEVTLNMGVGIRSGIEFISVMLSTVTDIRYWEIEANFDPQSLDETSQPVGNFTIPAVAT